MTCKWKQDHLTHALNEFVLENHLVMYVVHWRGGGGYGVIHYQWLKTGGLALMLLVHSYDLYHTAHLAVIGLICPGVSCCFA